MKDYTTRSKSVYECDLCKERLIVPTGHSPKEAAWLPINMEDESIAHVCPACRENFREADQAQIANRRRTQHKEVIMGSMYVDPDKKIEELTKERDLYKEAFEVMFKIAEDHDVARCPDRMPGRTRCPYAGEIVPKDGCMNCHLDWINKPT